MLDGKRLKQFTHEVLPQVANIILVKLTPERTQEYFSQKQLTVEPTLALNAIVHYEKMDHESRLNIL